MVWGHASSWISDILRMCNLGVKYMARVDDLLPNLVSAFEDVFTQKEAAKQLVIQ